MVNFTIRWHPQYAIHPKDDGSAVFIAETEQFLLPESLFSPLDAVAQKQGKLSDYLFADQDVAKSVDRLGQVDELLDDNILFDEAEDCEIRHTLVDFGGEIDCSSINHRSVYNLSCVVEQSVLALLTDVLPLNVVLVVVDDYLDPRLCGLSEQLSEDAKSWLIVKPYGTTSAAGPLFAVDTEGPCYQCLRDRLEQNNPVRVWQARQNADKQIMPTPLMVSGKSIEITLSLMATVLGDSGLPHWYTQSVDGTSSERHPVDKRPQCSACGEPQRFVQDNHQPLRLDDIIRHPDVDGGYRAISREDFIAMVSPLVDAQSGIIRQLDELVSCDDSGLQIYRAAYAQNTFDKQGLSVDSFVEQALGKGLSTTQCQSSAMGEALERQAAQYVGDEGIVCAVPEQLSDKVYLPHQLASFSERQYLAFAGQSGRSIHNPQWVVRFDAEQQMHWAKGWSLSEGHAVYFPAAFCFANTPFSDRIYSSYTHNGNACGSNKEEAMLQGLMELIERDAVAIWWYNQIPRPEVSLDIIGEQAKQKIDKALAGQWQYWLLDVSNNIDVVTCVAVGRHVQSKKFVMGFGTHLDPSVAAQRALTEMYQLITIKDRVSGPFDFDAIANKPFMYPKRRTFAKTLADYQYLDSDNLKHNIVDIVEQLKGLGLDVCVVDYSRADLPVATLKVIVPGLVHFWPQLANQRLYQVPVELGWLSQPLHENELNAQPLYL